MRIGLAALLDRVRSSLFLVPMLFVVGGAVLGQVSLEVDSALTDRDVQLPFVLQSTVDNARAVLSTVATATITVAGIAFSISLLVIQLASSQYSPRVVHSLFRDPFTKRVMGLVVGTFTYCLVVLRSVRDALDDGGQAVVPNLSVALALLLGVASILATIAFINHSAHSMDVSELLHDVTEESLRAVERGWPTSSGPGALEDPPPVEGHEVRFTANGWIQYVDADALMAVAAPGGVVRLESEVGRYAVAGTPLATVWPVPDPDDRDPLAGRLRAAVHVGQSRTLQQDASYGVRQLVDVALRALSPGVNDPTTAQDAIFHLAAVLHEALERDCPPRAVEGDGGRRLLRPEAPDHGDLVDLALDELRVAARALPTVCVYLLEAIHLLCLSQQVVDRPAVREPLLRQARLVRDGAAAADLLPEDRERVRAAYASRFEGG
ncbi:DUF2254 domain-containing protein [Iamia majanohamensis]|uniref:DUF2254 domain-containing protein n=1 Tax=Iamia majanohamensis TaxID=467976 RepID=A0AAF0BTX4_9ACTN|nr:DUF2254 domain-containing protein [Iamia majanohamensis]WCO67222.1 DUF2254 domain-containing protein [Iamia majanohamensis]